MAIINPGLQYGYIPTEWICALFVSLFGLAALIHLGKAIHFRMWWLLPTIVLGVVGEVVGWSGRLWSSKTFLGNAFNPYLMQISSTIISPTPILAANFVILGTIIGQLGSRYSRLGPRWYTIVFCTSDVVALVVQAVGGASASEAASPSDGGDPETGAHIMLAGIVIQLVAIIIYASLATEFLFRYNKDRPVRHTSVDNGRGVLDHKIKRMILGLIISTVCIFIRSIYRTIELSNGWTGDVIRTQVYFNVFDGAMICISVYTLAILHPGNLLSHIPAAAGKKSAGSDKFDSRVDIALMSRNGSGSVEYGGTRRVQLSDV
ncbi:hypothetical protein M0805_003676 [Coniferiporia weirii]|nr:hypothetical protein M0805_003676 [Coniferiporia weirii]